MNVELAAQLHLIRNQLLELATKFVDELIANDDDGILVEYREALLHETLQHLVLQVVNTVHTGVQQHETIDAEATVGDSCPDNSSCNCQAHPRALPPGVG